MQIVIDIPDFIYNALKEDVDCGTVNLNQAIVNGTVLPKGHGDLIDANELINDIVEYSTNLGGVMAVKTECIKVLFEIATTIVEADKK